MPTLHPFVSGAFQRRCGERRLARIGASQSGSGGDVGDTDGEAVGVCVRRRYRFLGVWHKRPTKIDGAVGEASASNAYVGARGTGNINDATANPAIQSFARTAEYI